VAGWSARRWASVGAAALLVVAGAAGWWWLHTRTDHTTTAISVDQAIQDYRGSTVPPPTSTSVAPGGSVAPTTATSAVPAPSPLPEPGVYTYATTGGDGVDALGGAGHDFPAATTVTVTVTPDGCATQRWTAAEERWDETTACSVQGGLQLQRFVAFHRFFGSDDQETDDCTGQPRPVGAPAGTTWTATCISGEQTSVHHGTVVGAETLTVGGAPVGTEHVSVTIDDGDTRDVQRTDTWYLSGGDLVVRRVSDIATTEGSPVGDVHYTEHYELSLASLQPAG
jgi:hypothetical protein